MATPLPHDGDSTADLRDPTLYINRELSLLEFHKRVLRQAVAHENPPLERLRFLTISSSILDEFFEIRVAGLKEQISIGLSKVGPDGLGPAETFRLCRKEVLALVEEQYRILNDVILNELREQSIVVYRRDELNEEQREWLEEHFRREVLPVLTPIGLDPAHPFPRILNKSLNFIVSLDGKDAFGRKAQNAIVQAPRVLPRLIRMPDEISGATDGFVLLSSMIHAHIDQLFHGMRIAECHQFRVTRNSDLWIDEEEVKDFMLALKGELTQRHYGRGVRLEVSSSCPDELVLFLLSQFELEEDDLYRVDGPVNLHRLGSLCDHVDRPHLKFPPFVPGLPAKVARARGKLFSILQRGDVLLHHPYQSFTPVLDLLREAATDPDVLAIKITIYRTGMDSPMGEALLAAAKAGKEVTCVVELRARFDEAANIELASRLQEAGAKVVYGVVGFKAHAKMLLVVRRENGELRHYSHLGTGNYNPGTARTYTDFGFMTGDPTIGADVHAVFQQLTGVSRGRSLEKLVQTPFHLHERILELIEGEIENAKEGKPARIYAKMNSLIEKKVIETLYRASRAGVEVDLIVRGVCCLRPGVPGVSENIRVRSVVGRFLEHHRVFCFHAGGEELTYCSSADWMPRNFFHRVEVTFPIEGKKHRARVIREAFHVMLEDNCLAWEMKPDGRYEIARPAPNEPILPAQQILLDSLAKRVN